MDAPVTLIKHVTLVALVNVSGNNRRNRHLANLVRYIYEGSWHVLDSHKPGMFTLRLELTFMVSRHLHGLSLVAPVTFINHVTSIPFVNVSGNNRRNRSCMTQLKTEYNNNTNETWYGLDGFKQVDSKLKKSCKLYFFFFFFFFFQIIVLLLIVHLFILYKQ